MQKINQEFIDLFLKNLKEELKNYSYPKSEMIINEKQEKEK